MAIEAVIFDWFCTLGAPHEDDFWTRMPEIIQAAGGQAHPDAIEEWNALPTEHVDYSLGEDAYRAWQTDRIVTLLKRCGVSEPGRSALAEELDSIRYGRLFNVFPDVPEGLKELRGRGLRLGLCSNWDWDLDRHLHHSGIHGLFDTIVCSASAGFRKPHPRIFAAVIDRMGLRPENMLFVGDTWSDDVEGAIAAGLQAVHIARTECAVTEHLDVPCVTDLLTLAKVI